MASLNSVFTDIANAIRKKNLSAEKYAPVNMAKAIDGILSEASKILSTGEQHLQTTAYINGSVFHPNDDGEKYNEGTKNVSMSVFAVQKDHAYVFFVGKTAGNRFRVAKFQTNPFESDLTANITGTDPYQISDEDVKQYVNYTYIPASNGYVVVETNLSDDNTGIPAYSIDLTTLDV